MDLGHLLQHSGPRIHPQNTPCWTKIFADVFFSTQKLKIFNDRSGRTNFFVDGGRNSEVENGLYVLKYFTHSTTLNRNCRQVYQAIIFLQKLIFRRVISPVSLQVCLQEKSVRLSFSVGYFVNYKKFTKNEPQYKSKLPKGFLEPICRCVKTTLINISYSDTVTIHRRRVLKHKPEQLQIVFQ